MTIDDKLKEDNIKRFGREETPRCWNNNLLQYRSRDNERAGVFYCAVSDITCPYYNKERMNEFCTATNYSFKKRGL